MKIKLLFLMLSFSIQLAYSQTDSTSLDDDDMDFSQYADAELAGGVKRYCNSKVLDISPNKLISIGYDFVGPHQVTNYGPDTASSNINNMQGLRIGLNIPVISKTHLLWSVGANYWRMGYGFNDAPVKNQFIQTLHQHGLTTMGLNTTLFKPFDEKHFLLAFVSGDINGDFKLNDNNLSTYFSKYTYTIAALYGVKKNDRSMIAYGLTRTYRAGNQTIFPILLFNHTFENRKWGIEMLLPSRFNIRRNFNPRNLLLAGFEMEGNAYYLLNRTSPVNSNYDNLFLRRSEIRPRITYERSISGFIWLSLQLGYRINFRYDIDRGDVFRWLGDDEGYAQLNDLSNSFYFGISLNLVSP
jgi:hypothetical protein